MSFARTFLSVLLCYAMALPGFAQQKSGLYTGEEHGIAGWFSNNYRAHPVAETNYTDSLRLEKLMRAGNIYLSLRDAIALALENNLDLEYARYNPKLAEANLLRAQSGSLLRNVSSSISSGPSSASLGVLASNALGSGGTSQNSGSGQGGVLSGLSVQLAGSAIPNLDPVFFVNGQFVHNTTIETATNITGTNFLVTQYKSSNYGIQEGLLSGTTLQAGNGQHVRRNPEFTLQHVQPL